jgi:hypothetical protein
LLVNGREIIDYTTVQRWMGSKSVDPIQATWRRRNLQVLADFCLHQKTDPDAMIIAAANQDNRNDFMRSLKKWIKIYENSEDRRDDPENAVRSFFIGNGLRVLTRPYLDVYNRSRS